MTTTHVACTTDINVTTGSSTLFTWTIQKLKNRVEEYSMDRIFSNEFNVKESEGRTTTWMLELLPNKCQLRSEKCV